MVTVKLYKTSTPNNYITKTLSNEISLDCVYKDTVSVIKPTLVINTSTNLATYNYAYISDNNRYYYITNIKHVKNNIYELDLKVDVLFSHKTEILNNNAVIERQANSYNLYLNDDIFKVYNKVNLVTKNFSSGFTRNGSYLLTVIG